MAYGATHRFRRDTRTDMFRNILKQDINFLAAHRFKSGLKWHLDTETDRLDGLVNGSVRKVGLNIIQCYNQSMFSVKISLY